MGHLQLEGPQIQPVQERMRGASLVAQWEGIHLSEQETGVQFLVQENPTCHMATKSVATTIGPELSSLGDATTEVCVPRPRAPQQEKPRQREARAPQPESGPHWPQLEKPMQQQRSSTAKQ